MIKSVQATTVINFRCENCGKEQYHPYSLEWDFENMEANDDLVLLADNIDCVECNHTNYVVGD